MFSDGSTAWDPRCRQPTASGRCGELDHADLEPVQAELAVVGDRFTGQSMVPNARSGAPTPRAVDTATSILIPYFHVDACHLAPATTSSGRVRVRDGTPSAHPIARPSQFPQPAWDDPFVYFDDQAAKRAGNGFASISHDLDHAGVRQVAAAAPIKLDGDQCHRAASPVLAKPSLRYRSARICFLLSTDTGSRQTSATVELSSSRTGCSLAPFAHR